MPLGVAGKLCTESAMDAADPLYMFVESTGLAVESHFLGVTITPID